MADLRQWNNNFYVLLKYRPGGKKQKLSSDWDLIIIKKNIESYICIHAKHNCIYRFQTIYYYTNFGNKYLQTNNIKLYKKTFPLQVQCQKIWQKYIERYSL